MSQTYDTRTIAFPVRLVGRERRRPPSNIARGARGRARREASTPGTPRRRPGCAGLPAGRSHLPAILSSSANRQTLMVLSRDPETIVSPSPESAIAVMPSLCPFRVRRSSPFLASQIINAWPSDPLMTCLPSFVMASDRMAPVWPDDAEGGYRLLRRELPYLDRLVARTADHIAAVGRDRQHVDRCLMALHGAEGKAVPEVPHPDREPVLGMIGRADGGGLSRHRGERTDNSRAIVKSCVWADHAAARSWRSPSTNLTPRMISARWFDPSSFLHFLRAHWHSLKTMAIAVLRDRQPLVR